MDKENHFGKKFLPNLYFGWHFFFRQRNIVIHMILSWNIFFVCMWSPKLSQCDSSGSCIWRSNKMLIMFHIFCMMWMHSRFRLFDWQVLSKILKFIKVLRIDFQNISRDGAKKWILNNKVVLIIVTVNCQHSYLFTSVTKKKITRFSGFIFLEKSCNQQRQISASPFRKKVRDPTQFFAKLNYKKAVIICEEGSSCMKHFLPFRRGRWKTGRKLTMVSQMFP